MLGLRPRLKPRPSLLDLIRKNNIDELSQSPSHSAPLEPADAPTLVPLPASPAVVPRVEVTGPPPYSLQEGSEEVPVVEEEEAKMAPVSCDARIKSSFHS